MKFTIIREDGVGVMTCEDVLCVPSYDTLKDMYAAGYRFNLNGKNATLKRMKEFLNEHK